MGLLDSQPQDNAQIAFNYFVSQGLSPVQAAGIVGNLQGESGRGLNTGTVNPGDGRDGSDSIGIAQWNSARAQALKDYAASKGVPHTDLNTQLEFLHQELKGPEKAAYDSLLAAQTPEEATRAMLAFERPKDWNVPGSHANRYQYASKALTSYGGGQPQPAPATPAAPANGLLAAPQSGGLMAGGPAAQASPAGTEQAAGGLMAQMAPPDQPPPIFFAPRRMPDLSKLKSAFKPPVFSRG